MSPRPAARDALALAAQRFTAAGRLDMSALADELGINRVTLYRWFGSRHRLLIEVLWHLAREVLVEAEQGGGGRGAERIVGVVSRFIDGIVSRPGIRRWVSDEGDHAMRLLTRRDSDYQARLVRAIADLLEQERLDLPVERREFAQVLVRLIESYSYLDLMAGEAPSARRAEPILRLLLR